MLAIELGLRQVHRRSDTDLLPVANKLNPPRCRRKYIGFLFILTCLATLYWFLPNYDRTRYQSVFELAAAALPLLLALAPLYLLWVDRQQKHPEDTYYQLGTWLCGKQPIWSAAETKNFALGWLVKGFFLPVMLSFLFSNLTQFNEHPLSFATFPQFYISCLLLIYALDVTFGCIGYLCTLRPLDAHIRQADTTAFGWFFTLVCYPPLSIFAAREILGSSRNGDWQEALFLYPLLYITWGFVIILILSVYVWSTVSFGCRFSNLTNRGIITYGPYRYTKHPAYLSKCVGWWFLYTPFLLYGSLELILKASLILLLKMGIYWCRAKSEERLLGQDPAYQQYAAWMEEYGFGAQLRQAWQRWRQPTGALQPGKQPVN